MNISKKLLLTAPLGTEFVLEVVSESMEPVLKKGSHVIVVRSDIDTVSAGDVIAFIIPTYRYPIIHRAVDLKSTDNASRYCVTKGDSIDNEDPWIVTEYNFIGKINLYS